MVLGVLYCVLAVAFLVLMSVKVRKSDPVPLFPMTLFIAAIIGVLNVVNVDADIRVWIGILLIAAILFYLAIYGAPHRLYVVLTVLTITSTYVVMSIIALDVFDNRLYGAFFLIVLILICAWLRKLDASIERKVRER